MVRRITKVQLLVFALITLLGITYVGINYVGINPLRSPYTVKLALPSAGGIYTNADVAERGVVIGRVGAIHIVGRGIVADLKINHGVKIPTAANCATPPCLTATVADLSAVGEQYVELEPATDSGPDLKAGQYIGGPGYVGQIPVDDAVILGNFEKLLASVNVHDLSTVVKELGTSFANLGAPLQKLIDNSDALTESAENALPATEKLINDGKTVLDTQRDVARELKTFARTFADFSQTLADKDPSLRGVLDNGVLASKQVQALLADNSDVLPTLLSNLITFNGIQAVRLPQVRTVLEIYPADTAAGFHTTPGDGTAHFGQITDSSNPCQTGYSSTKLRSNNPVDWGGPANLDAYCHGSGITTDYRGSRFVAKPSGDHANITNSSPDNGEPTYGKSSKTPSGKAGSTSGANSSSRSADTVIQTPYDPATGVVEGLDGKAYQLGFNGPLAPVFGSSSWEWLLLAPTMK
jgi:phospholipid/cholesterol/gamma-HCH transport system substrate-binding protein